MVPTFSFLRDQNDIFQKFKTTINQVECAMTHFENKETKIKSIEIKMDFLKYKKEK